MAATNLKDQPFFFIEENCPIVQMDNLSDEVFSLRFKSRKIVQNTRPGQFLMIRIPDFNEPLFRRAFSISRIYPEKDEFEILVLISSFSSKILSGRQINDALDIIGPLGSAFDYQVNPGDLAILVAGGIGIAPMFILYDFLKSKTANIKLLFGARTVNQLIPLRDLEPAAHYITEDGSKGDRGYVTDLLKNVILENSNHNIRVYACGPRRMLHLVSHITEIYGIKCQITVETAMICGTGLCKGCAVESKDPARHFYYACTDGPVFDRESIL